MRQQIFYVTVLIFFLVVPPLKGQMEDKHEWLVEVDPLPFLMGGQGGHIGWSPKSSQNFTFGLAMVSGMEIPNAIVNLEEKNKDQEWSVRINQGLGVWSHYYFQERNKGWFTGLQVFTQEMELTNQDYPGESDRTNTILIALQGGYVWYPFQKAGFYLRPWAGLGHQSTINGSFKPEEVDPEMVIGDREYFLPSLMPFATIHFGYKF